MTKECPVTSTDVEQVIPPDPRQLASHHRCVISLALSLFVARAGEFQRYAASPCGVKP